MDLTGGIGLFLVVLGAVAVATLGLVVVGVIINRVAAHQEDTGSR